MRKKPWNINNGHRNNIPNSDRNPRSVGYFCSGSEIEGVSLGICNWFNITAVLGGDLCPLRSVPIVAAVGVVHMELVAGLSQPLEER